MSVAIVTHCWAKDKPLYAVLLRYQLSSLVLNPPVTKTTIVVAYSPTDPYTADVVSWFSRKLTNMHVIPLPDPEMWRRAIARNIAAGEFGASNELLWFTDCDYLFGKGCIDSAVAAWHQRERPEMIWPRSYLANEDKSIVDYLIEHYTGQPVDRLLEFDDICAKPTPVLRAIGGLQITSGSYAKLHGYLPGGRWQKQPLSPFPDFRDDVAFRARIERNFRYVGIPSLPGLVRLRHTEVGYGLDK